MHKELIARLRVGAGIERKRVVYSGWAPLADETADAIEELQVERDTLRQQLTEAQARTEDVMKELLWIRHRMRKDEVNDGVVITNAVGSQWSKWIDRVDAIKKAMKGAA
jgi:hypothetical protein